MNYLLNKEAFPGIEINATVDMNALFLLIEPKDEWDYGITLIGMIMHRLISIFTFVSFLLSFAPATSDVLIVEDVDRSESSGVFGDKYLSLQFAMERAIDGDTILIKPGIYHAQPTAYTEDLCGNCLEHKTTVKATRGFIIDNRDIVIMGSGPDRTRLVTNAGYGVYIEDSSPVYISGLKITGGVRDEDGNATDAAIVVRNSRVTITDCEISGNTYRDSSVVVGIGGIFGREGAELFIINNLIENNGWDGVALYRGATAFIADNVIRKGRGVGIGITWDAAATVLRNRISEYWKGIGSFGDTRVVARHNEVFDNLGWGIIATGTSWMDASNNTVIRNGNCGMAVWGPDCMGRFTNNLIVENGWREEWVCPCVGIWAYSGEDTTMVTEDRLESFEISFNNVWGNEAGEYRNMPDLTGRFGNISIEPEFLNPSDSTDFRLKPASPLIDSGNPLLTDPDGSRPDIGARL
ncbi:MAG: hypothetical protein GF315_08955 [candidate division Zixibacteria bacterium]|nr:hypothetical protein [candidate division Zixibacteria bacterium]